jgi:hypothetical protein
MDFEDELKLVELIGREARPPKGDDCDGEMSGDWIGGKKVDAVAVVIFGGLFSLAGSWPGFILPG